MASLSKGNDHYSNKICSQAETALKFTFQSLDGGGIYKILFSKITS